MINVEEQIDAMFDYLNKFPIQKRLKAAQDWLLSKDFNSEDLVKLKEEYAKQLHKQIPTPEKVFDTILK